MAGMGLSAISSRLRVGIGVSPESCGSSSGGLPCPGMGTKQRRAQCWCGDLSALFGFCRSSSGEGPPPPPSLQQLLQGEAVPGEIALGMEPTVPKGLPSLSRPAPSLPIHQVKNSFWGSF